MVSAASTVTVFFNPDTDRLAQWPLITILLEIPLTVTTLSLHTIDLFSPTPLTVSVPPGVGAGDVGDVDGAAVGVLLFDGLWVRGVDRGELVSTEVLGWGDTTKSRWSWRDT